MSVLIKRMTGTMVVETAAAERGKPACSKYATNGCVRRSGPSPVRNAATHELTSSIDKTSGFIEDCYGVAEDWLLESTPLSRGRTARRARTAPSRGGILRHGSFTCNFRRLATAEEATEEAAEEAAEALTAAAAGSHSR